MPEYIYDDHPEWEGLSPDQLPDWYNKGYASQSDYLLKTTGNAQPAVVPIPDNQLEGLTTQQIMPQQQALLTPEQQSIVNNTDQQVAFQNTPTPTPAPQPQQPTAQPQQPTQTATPRIYDEILKGFGTPEAYAKAISDKMGAGQQFSNPDAAKQFMTDRPDLFQGANQPATIDPNLFPRADAGEGIGTSADAGTGERLQGTGTSQTGEFKSQYSDDIQSLLNRLDKMLNPEVPTDITQTPIYKAYMDSANIMMDEAGRQIMESLNARGILNSTITGYNVSMARTKIMAQIMPQILRDVHNLQQDEINNIMDQVNQYIKLDQEDYDRYLTGEEAKAKKELREYERAWDRSEATGFISNDDAIILGVAPGPTFQYTKWMAEEIYKQQKYVDDLAMEKEKLNLDQAEYDERVRSNKATEKRLASSKSSGSGGGSSSSAGLTPSGYYSGFPDITPAVEKELDMTKEQIAAGAREAGVTNSQYISQARDMASSKAYYAIADSIVEAAKLYRQQNNKMLPAEEAMKVVDANVAQGLLNKEDEKNLRQWVTDSFGF